jgi:hypothetical protein
MWIGSGVLLPDPGERRGVLGEAGPAVAGAGVEELVPDPAVEAHALRHRLDVGADLFAERRDLVDEGDLGREEGVGGVLDHLGRFEIGVDDGEVAQEERAVDVAHHALRAVRFDADDHAIGAHEVVDRRAFAQELWVRCDVEGGVGAGGAHDLLDLAVGADGDGRFRDDHGVAGQRAGDLLGGGEDVGEVGVAVAAAGGGAHGDEDRLGAVRPPARDRW